MTIKKIIWIVLLLIVITIAAWFLAKDEKLVVTTSFVECVDQGGTVMETYPRQCKSPNGLLFVEDIGEALSKLDLIKAFKPVPNEEVESPLTIAGEARGNWYFEATFPIEIIDAEGKVLGRGFATAQSEWMTTEFVPFTSELEFEESTTDTGTLILHKDNPSGLPAHDDSIEIPVRFR